MAKRVVYLILTDDSGLVKNLRDILEQWKDYCWWKLIVKYYDSEDSVPYSEQKPYYETTEASKRTKDRSE